MNRSLTVLMAAAECRGFAKVGGLGDVVFDLSVRLAARHNVLVVLPLYSSFRPAHLGKSRLSFPVTFEGRAQPAELYETAVGGLKVFLIEAEFFSGDGGSVYVDSGKRGKGPFEDDARRFAFYCAALWELVRNHAPFSQAEILHCHDWHTGLLPLFVRLSGMESRFRTLFTIHNLDYQGTRPFDEPYAPGASWRQWFPEHWDPLLSSGLRDLISDPQAAQCFNPMRCAVRCSDAVNTVSPTYAEEITKPDRPAGNFLGGRGLEVDLALRQKEGRLWGILNGLDYEIFDPEKLDPPFRADSAALLALRRSHRETLWRDLPRLVEQIEVKHGRKFGNSHRVKEHLNQFLEAAQGLPLTVCVTRAVSQKLGLFTEDWEPGLPMLKAFQERGTALLVVGTGELEEKLEPLNDEPHSLFLQVFDAEFAALLYAAGELFLMPSDFEPCGISQLMALRYGCLPLVHDRGGLHDTVKDRKTGFLFEGRTRKAAKAAFLDCVSDAVAAVSGPTYEAMVRQAMAERFEWDSSVEQYESIYQKILTDLLDRSVTPNLLSKKPRKGKGAS